ncbi:MAG TPA: transposase [Saprospiraceae bacterium]|nr:transposase [Saprospiraceae bacterium]HNT20542.1 transposase [Saprospiraceae bacterium]
MRYQSHQVYHIFNQGNNREKIFFEPCNYEYFKAKLRRYVCPNADLLAYCLMPNHFHLLIYTSDLSVQEYKNSGLQNISFAISQLLSSYTKGINRRFNRTGSLFRSKTKKKDGWNNDNDFRSIAEFEGKALSHVENVYALRVFNYIHENPVKARLVRTAEEWVYSSAREFSKVEEKPLCNIERAKYLLGV